MFPLAFLLAMKIAPDSPGVTYLQPQLASTGDRVGVAFGSGNTIFYSWSDNHGERFSRPARIDTGGRLALGRHRGPRIAYQSGNVVISAIVGQKGGGADGDLLAWRSADNGTTWEGPARVNDVSGSAREGLHAMTSGNGWVVAVWLDLRQKGTRLFGSMSSNGGGTWSENFLIYESPDGSISECCHPSVSVGPGGAIHVLWRNKLEGSRDLYVSTSTSQGKTWSQARKLGQGTWKLDACPMDGGGLAVASDNRLYGVWRREKTIFAGRPDGEEVELGTGKDPALASGLNESLYAVWADTGGIMTRSRKNDRIDTLSPTGAFPQVIFTGRRVLAVWEQDRGIATAVVDEPVPPASRASQ
jgi:hypothetical protein